MLGKILFLLIVMLYGASAAQLRMDDVREEYSLSSHIEYYEDKEGLLSFDEVRTRPFLYLHQAVPSFGFTSSVYWFKVRVIPSKNSKEEHWWLSVTYPLLDHVQFFQVDEDGKWRSSQQSGEEEAFGYRELEDRHFHFRVGIQERPVTLYLRVTTNGSMQVPMVLHTSEDIIETIQVPLLLTGLYYGVFIIIFLYNLILYFYTRERNYVYYLLFISSFIGWQMTLDGLGVQYFWTSWPWVVEHMAPLWMSLATFFAIMFSRSFLRTKENAGWLDTLLLILLLLSGVMMTGTLFIAYDIIVTINAIIGAIAALTLFVTGVVMFRRDYRPARFYIAGWSAFLVGTVVFALNKFDLIGGFYLFNHAQQVGSAIEMILLSWALADRVKLLQDEYVEKLSGLNLVLQGKVREGLESAREKDRMMLKQSKLAALGEMIEQIAHQWRQPLNTLALISQDLYFKVQLGQFKAEDFEKAHEQINNNLQYMSKTIDDFRNLHMSDKEEEHFSLEELVNSVVSLNEASLKFSNITCTIFTSGEHYIKTAKNELIQILMNLIKNARDAIVVHQIQEGRIIVGVEEERDKVMLFIEDNGGGIPSEIAENIFDPYYTTKSKDKGSGIGLYMSKSIIEESMHGSLTVVNGSMGARFVITLPKGSPKDREPGSALK